MVVAADTADGRTAVKRCRWVEGGEGAGKVVLCVMLVVAGAADHTAVIHLVVTLKHCRYWEPIRGALARKSLGIAVAQ